MRRYRVELSPEAVRHIEAIDGWWTAHRLDAKGLFVREIRTALRHLRRVPHSGQRYEPAGLRPMRRLVLPRSGYHVYFSPDDLAGIVRVYAVWHTARGAGPRTP